jgi:hypothetical protein
VSREQDAIEKACGELAEYFGRLEDLALEPAAETGVTAPGLHSRRAVIPEPYGQAGRARMDIHEGVRRLEARLRIIVLGHPGPKRGGSDENTWSALGMVAKLASQLDDKGYSRAASFLDGWINEARCVRGIDEARRWRHLPRHANDTGLPARCPYCKTFYLLADPETGIVVCSVPGCVDSEGNAPVGSVGAAESGVPVLTWADGRVDAAPPELEAAS